MSKARLHTASEVISFARRLENESAGLYQELSQRYPADGEVFLAYARENGKNVVQFERAYYGVISDAIEGAFAFDIDPDEYTFETAQTGDTNFADILAKAIEMEEKIVKFYSDAAEQSKSLLADVPRVFVIIARKRNNRGTKLMSLLGKGDE